MSVDNDPSAVDKTAIEAELSPDDEHKIEKVIDFIIASGVAHKRYLSKDGRAILRKELLSRVESEFKRINQGEKRKTVSDVLGLVIRECEVNIKVIKSRKAKKVTEEGLKLFESFSGLRGTPDGVVEGMFGRNKDNQGGEN